MLATTTLRILAQDGGEIVLFGGGLMMLIMAVLAIAGFVLWVWALIDAIKNPALDSTMRLVWVLVILFTNLLGAIIYLVIGRSSATQSHAM